MDFSSVGDAMEREFAYNITQKPNMSNPWLCRVPGVLFNSPFLKALPLVHPQYSPMHQRVMHRPEMIRLL